MFFSITLPSEADTTAGSCIPSALLISGIFEKKAFQEKNANMQCYRINQVNKAMVTDLKKTFSHK